MPQRQMLMFPLSLRLRNMDPSSGAESFLVLFLTHSLRD